MRRREFITLVGGAGIARRERSGAIDRQSLTIASAEVKWRNRVSFAATFEGEFSSNSSSYAGKGVTRYQW